jgi:sortase A
VEVKRNIFIGLALAGLFFLAANFDFVRTQVEFAIRGAPQQPQPVLPQLPLDQQAPPAKIGPPNLLTISSLAIKAPIQYPPDNREETFQRFLQDGVAHYPGTARPGQLGNVYIFGHSSDFTWSKGDYKTVFALLPKIKVGDSITLTDERGVEFTYKVTSTAVVGAKDTSVLDQRGNKQRLLTLQTSYPIGTALKRFVAVAELEGPAKR